METTYIKEILRLHHVENLDRSRIASSLGVSYSTVTRTLERIEGADIDQLLKLEGSELENAIYPIRPGPKVKIELDYETLEYCLRELKRRGVTKQLLHLEYTKNHPDAPISYSSFCQRLREHANAKRLSMLLNHDPGEVLFIDYCGDKIPIIDNSGEVAFECEVFVATLAASGMTYFEAHGSQNASSFSAGITTALAYFGGTTSIWVVDNLKAGVTTNTKTDLRLSRAMVELSSHYQVVVEPTRPGRPRDKARVEERVGYIQRNVIAALRDSKFASLDEVNTSLSSFIDAVNKKPMARSKF